MKKKKYTMKVIHEREYGKRDLQAKIKEYLTPEIGVAIRDACDLIIRLRLGQLNQVAETLKRSCSLHQEGKGVSLDEPLYKGVELGEYLMCLKDHPDCLYAKECWITRKGFAKCRDKEKGCCDVIPKLLKGKTKERMVRKGGHNV